MEVISETQATKNTILEKTIDDDNNLKSWLVQYVGQQHDKEQVTVGMIVETISVEFPEFLLAIAEENWVLGYKQGLADVEEGKRLIAEMHTKAGQENV